ncbi:MAG TPA: PIN domain-containing protein [Ktedonobacteraceae bacterium]|nr:PIN domain-containing protein [Ktedonobacteraceae bacterium]
MSVERFPCAGILLDACVVINLFASKQMQAILEALPRPVAIATFVHEKEVLKIYTGPDDNITAEAEAISLQPFIDQKLLHVVPNDSRELATMLKISETYIDTGEAISAAIARHRSWSLATDDKIALSFFMRNMPDLHLISTLDLVKHWAEATQPHLAAIADALANIHKRARYAPHHDHDLYQWWKMYQQGQT